MLSLFKRTALEGAETLINAALTKDPASKQALTKLEGQVLLVESTLPPLTIAIEPTATGIQLHDNWDGNVAVTINGTLIAMAAIAVNAKESISFSGTGVNVSGNLDTLHQLNKIMGDVDIDWEGALAEIIGDIPAHLVAKGIRNSAVIRKDIVTRASSGLVEVAQEEFNLTPSKNEFEAIIPDIRQLSADADRLAARVKRLYQKITPSDPGALNS
jgi:ubiquinone biosynthesis protein UbiJ